MRRLTVPLLVSLAIAGAGPRAAHATTRLGIGADFHLEGRGIFQLTLSADTYIARHLSVGGRFGALIASTPTTFGVPLDLFLHVQLRRIYFEGMVGPWIFLGTPSVRLHAAFGFGIDARGGLSVGLEVGWLDPSPIIGLRVAMRL